MSKKGEFWRKVVFEDHGVPIYPEESEQREVPIDFDVDSDNIARVNVSYGRTINLGNYNNARIDIGVELPCDVREMQECYEAAVEFIGPKYVETINEVIQKRKSKNSGEAVIDSMKDNKG